MKTSVMYSLNQMVIEDMERNMDHQTLYGLVTFIYEEREKRKKLKTRHLLIRSFSICKTDRSFIRKKKLNLEKSNQKAKPLKQKEQNQIFL